MAVSRHDMSGPRQRPRFIERQQKGDCIAFIPTTGLEDAVFSVAIRACEVPRATEDPPDLPDRF